MQYKVKTMKYPELLIHKANDNVGVAVVENLKANTEALAVITHDNSELTIRVFEDIPIGHKVALKDFYIGDTIIKYGQDIGKIVADVKKGHHVHTQNLKTKRW